MTLKTLIVKILIFLTVFPVTPTIAVLTTLYSSMAHSRNDYLQGYFQQCRTGDVSIESSYNERDSAHSNTYPNSISNNNSNYGDGSDRRIGVRWTWYLGSNCTDTTKTLILENMELAQQLELLKMCKRYNNKKLPPQFSTLAKKCEGVVEGIEIESRPPEGGGSYYDEIIKDIKENPEKHKNPNTYYSEEIKNELPKDELRSLELRKPLVIPDFN
jgi:hypothetical protein